MSLKSILTESFQIIKDEINKSKKLEGKNLDKFKMIYGIGDLDGDVYVNKYNVILTTKEDYDKLKYCITDDKHVLKYNIVDYGMGLFVFRHINDRMLKECLL